MIWSRWLCSAALLGAALAQVNITRLLTDFPPCTMQCAIKVLPPAKCEFTDIRNCMCTNDDLQYDVSMCVLETCNVTEQYTSLTVFQTEVCYGVPQRSRISYFTRTSIILAAFAYPIIILRFISRALIAQTLWWDDYTILAATIFMIPLTVLSFYPAPQLGLGKHFYSVPPEDIPPLLKIFYAVQLIYVMIQTLPKASIILLYIRIFPSQRFRAVATCGLVFIALHAIAFFFAVAFQCSPVRSVWNRELSGSCINLQALIYSGAGFSIFEDFAIMVLPVVELKRLNLGLRKRIALGFMFALGSFACVTSIIRLTHIASYGNTIDQTWAYVDVIVWSEIECFTAVICACLMCIRPLVMLWLPGTNSQSSAYSRNNTNRSWGQKMGSKLRHSRLPDDESAQQPISSRGLNITTDSSVSYEMKSGTSDDTSLHHEKDDNGTPIPSKK